MYKIVLNEIKHNITQHFFAPYIYIFIYIYSYIYIYLFVTQIYNNDELSVHSGWLLLGFILAYVGPFRRYVGAKKFALKSKIFWCEKVGVGIAHVWPMLGHVETMLGLCLACLGPFWGQLGPCWGMLGLRWVIWGFNGVKN